MLNTNLLHPDILRVLAQAGHHSKVLIADGNYPAANKRGPRAELVSLQLLPGVPTVAQVFEAILGTVQIDEVFTMGVDRSDPYAAATPGDPLVAAWQANEPWIRGRVLLNPHAGFYSPHSLVDLRRKAIETAFCYLRDGTHANCVNAENLKKPR